MLTETMDELSSDPLFEGVFCKEAEAPRNDIPLVETFRAKCAENLCGMYGTCWSCPPGIPAEEAVSMVVSRPKAVLLWKRYENVDFSDKALLSEQSTGFQEMCRRFGNALRRKNVPDVLILGDGSCNYCGKCAYPDPCRYPDQRVVSISGLGIEMETYIPAQGLDFSFENDTYTLYGIILHN